MLKQERGSLEADQKKLLADEPLSSESDSELLTRWVAACRALCEVGEAADPATMNAQLKVVIKQVRVFPPKKIVKGKLTVGRIEVILPEWMVSVLSRAGGQGCPG